MNRNNWTNEKVLHQLTHNKSNKSYWDNIGVLRSRPSSELFSKCLELIQSESSKERTIGVDILAQLGLSQRPFLKQSIKLFFELLNTEKDSDVLMSVLFAIGHNHENLKISQIKKLCSFVSHPDGKIREGVVFALLGLEHDEALEALIQLSEDKLSQIRNWATFGLGDLVELDNQAIREALWKRVKDRHQETRYEAILGLAKRRDEKILAIIQKELLRENYAILLYGAVIATRNK